MLHMLHACPDVVLRHVSTGHRFLALPPPPPLFSLSASLESFGNFSSEAHL